jgi:hypothetical protein
LALHVSGWRVAGFGGRKEREFDGARGLELDAITALDYAGVSLFAATGALAASRKELDIIGLAFGWTLPTYRSRPGRDVDK